MKIVKQPDKHTSAYQVANNRQWPDPDPTNAQTLADFRFGKFPPKDHGGHHVEPTPTPTTTPAATK